MLAIRDMLKHVPLVAFLDAYPEPAFILCSNVLLHSSLDFIYGNTSLRELLIGHDDTGALDEHTFFSTLVSDEDIYWLSDPTRSISPTTVAEPRTIHVRPAWLPRDHTAVDLELTATPIDLPMTISGVGSASRSYVFTATPRRAPINLLRSETHEPRRKDPGLRTASISQRMRSRQSKSRSDSSSWPSQTPPAVGSADPPSRLIDTFPWETTALGPREKWPTCLKLMVKYLMEKPIPSSILWGWPDQVILYNDPYAKMIGSKHPGIFGKPGPAAWGELWESLAPVSELVRKGKATAKTDDQMFFHSLTELHLPEEVYHSWHWTPIWQEDGSVGGIWNTTWETTQKVIAERRLSGMSELFSRLSDARTREEFGERALEVLSRNPFDLPFIALYWCKTERSAASQSKGPPLALNYLRHHLSTSLIDVKLTLAGSVGIPEDHPIARPTINYTLDHVTHHSIHTYDPASDAVSPSTYRVGSPPRSATSVVSTSKSPECHAGLDLTRIFLSGTIELIDPLPAHLTHSLDSRGFKDPARAVAVLSISANPSSSPSDALSFPSAVLVLGLNTRRAYDADNAAWLESVGAGLSNQLAVVLQREADARMIEERERMDKAKTMFFTNVSHELRTPLTLVQGPLEQLVASPHVSGDVRYKLQLAMRNTRRLKKLIDSIMDMSKLEAGKLVGSFRPVQLGRVTADLATQFRSMAEKKGIEYEISCNTIHEPVVYVDIDLWEKIILNLLSNAFKYTTKGCVSVTVTHESAMSHVAVKDSGVGIPKEHLDQVFERFFRVDNNTAEGTGVGLSLTKELVSLHGGTLSLESHTKDEGEGDPGSVFTVSLPHGSAHLPTALVQEVGRNYSLGALQKEKDYWMELDQPTPSTTSAGEEEESAASSTLFFEKDDTLLIVDDNADMRAYINKIFAPYLTIFEASNGAEALRITKSRKVNLVLSDVMMPGMNGPEFLQRLREDKRTKLVPVIFVTAAEDPTLFAGKVEGAVDCISKPFKVRDLLARAHLQLQLGKRRVKLEEEFEVRSNELQVLTEMSPVGIFRTDADGKLTYLNPAWYQITGFPPERPRDEWLDHLVTGCKEDAIRVWRACFEDFKSSTVRLQWKNSVWTHCGIAPMISPTGDLLGSFGAITDINETYRFEEARIALAEEREHIAALRAEDAEAQRQMEVERRRAQGMYTKLLINVTSHELRQPVSAIIQNAEVVRTNMKGLRDLLQDCRKRNLSYAPTERILNELEDDLQAMESITQCGLAQARIANDVLSLSRIQLNVLSIIPTEFDVRRETNQILMVFRNELTTKEINFEIDLGQGAEMFGLQIISTDRSRYAQIITNLMSNAIRFTDMSTGSREIRVSLELSLHPPSDETCAPPSISGQNHATTFDSDDGSIYVYVSVQDSGPGLEKEDLALLFQRFQQGSNAHHVFGGSGLGLFVCRQLCTLMGGRIEVVSEPGKGATFRFFIKAASPAGQSSQLPAGFRVRRSGSIHSKASGISKTSGKSGSRPLPETPNLHHSRPLHVLITEDNKINRTVLARQMKRAGFTFALASNGLESIEAIEKSESQQSFDVVLMDLEMPVLDGFAATREIRKREASGSLQMRSFIIALTGNARLEQVQAARDAGVDDVIIKPYQIDALLSKMRAGYQNKPE